MDGVEVGGIEGQQSLIMFHDQRLPNVGIKMVIGEREEWSEVDVQINHAGEININQLALILRETHQLDPHSLLFYFDHSFSAFELVNQEVMQSVHFTSLICENFVTIKCEPKLSDQLLANPPKIDEITRTKRSRERKIEEAFLQIEQWRYFYREGCLNEIGGRVKVNLDQSAELVGVPRKTLEDYFLLFRTAKTIGFDFSKRRQEKIGTLRSFLRERGKAKQPNQKDIDERQFFRELRFQLLGVKSEEELFDCLKSNRSHSSSDEDMVFEN